MCFLREPDRLSPNIDIAMSETGSQSPSDPQDHSKKKSLPEKKGVEADPPAPVPIRPRHLVTKSKEQESEEPVEEAKEKEPEKEREKEKEKVSRLKPSGKTFQPRASARKVEEPVAESKEAAAELIEEPVVAEPDGKSHRHSERKGGPSFLHRLFRFKLAFAPVLIVFILLAIWIAFWAYGNGVAEGRLQAEREAQKEAPPLPPETMARLDKALFDLRNGHAADALKALSEMEATADIPSLSYLVALAALQNGDVDLVETQAHKSIRKREKVSDSLALLAVVESQRANDRSRVKMGSSIKRSEMLLGQAISADPANPYPRFELATLLRYDKRRDDAARELKGARSLLNPIDSHSIMDITTRIMVLEAMPLDQVPKTSDTTDNPQKLIPAAYAAMRLGDFARAASLLRTARDVLSFESFDYLVNDPAFRRYAQEPQLAEFYGK